VQGKAELVKPADALTLLEALYGEKLALYTRHERGAQHVSGYAFNNTYQYILNREGAHLEWLRAAIEGFGGAPGTAAREYEVPPEGPQAIAADDARTASAFVDTWAPKVAGFTNARHRKMLDLLLGEVREQQRFFELAATGRQDLLGRRPAGAGTGDGVLPTRWIE
jgi:hypothetical protein